MRLVVGKEPLRRILKWAQRALFACAVLLLGYCGFALVDAWVFQRRESRDLDRLLRDRRAASEGRPQPESSTAPKSAPAAAADGLIGRIEIPRLLPFRGGRRRGRQNHSPARGRTYSRHGAAGRARQRGPRRAPGHVLSPAEGSEDQGRDSILDAERQFQLRSRVAKGGGAGRCRGTRAVGRERADAGDLLPFLLRRAGAQAVDRKGQAGVAA